MVTQDGGQVETRTSVTTVVEKTRWMTTDATFIYTQKHCYPHIFLTLHNKVHNICKTYMFHTPTILDVTRCFHVTGILLIPTFWCHCLVLTNRRVPKLFLFFIEFGRFTGQKVYRSISGSKFGGEHVFLWTWKTIFSFLRVMENLIFRTETTKMFVKRFLLKRLLKISHFFHVEMLNVKKSW